jgi:hypothetical protein
MHEPLNGGHCFVRGNRADPDSMKHSPGVAGYVVFDGVKKRYPLCPNHLTRMSKEANVHTIQ